MSKRGLYTDSFLRVVLYTKLGDYTMGLKVNYDIRGREDALQTLADYIESYSEDMDLDPESVAYELHTHISNLGVEAQECYKDLVTHEVIDNTKEFADNPKDWKAGDVFVIGDVGDIDEKIISELHNLVGDNS